MFHVEYIGDVNKQNYLTPIAVTPDIISTVIWKYSRLLKTSLTYPNSCGSWHHFNRHLKTFETLHPQNMAHPNCGDTSHIPRWSYQGRFGRHTTGWRANTAAPCSPWHALGRGSPRISWIRRLRVGTGAGRSRRQRSRWKRTLLIRGMEKKRKLATMFFLLVRAIMFF